MAYFLKKLFVFVIFSLIVYYCLIIISGAVINIAFLKNLKYTIGGYGNAFTRMKEVKKIHDIDVLFVGSSHSYRGFDTRIFKESGYNAFNLGSSSQTPIQTSMLFKQYLPTLHPKLIVFEVYPSTFESDGVESAIDLLSNNTIDNYSIKMALETKNIKVFNTLLFSGFVQFFKLNANYVEQKIKKEDTYISGGFVERKLEKYEAKKTKTKASTYHLNPKQVLKFKEMISFLKEKKINYILVQAPISQKLYNSYSNNSEVDSVFNSLGIYYNFNKILHVDDSLFYDAHHLNQNGVEKFNASLIDALKK
jgi:hypothetical protein